MLAIICLTAAIVIDCALILGLKNDIADLNDTVNSHWKATQHECNEIWGVINGDAEDE